MHNFFPHSVYIRPIWQESIQANLSNDHTLYTSPLPGSGPVLAFILNILDGFLDLDNLYSVTNIQRIIEAFKFAYGYRTKLGDDNFVNISDVSFNFFFHLLGKFTVSNNTGGEQYDFQKLRRGDQNEN